MNSFRKLTLEKIAANMGILTSLVEQSLNPSSTENKPLGFKSLGSVGPGTTVMMPQNPVKADGTVDILINIRGIAGGDTKTANSLGANAVIVTAEAGGLGSLQNQQQFGNANFINSVVSKVLSFLQKQFPDKQIKRGKLVVSGFSGGGGAIASLLTQKNQVEGGIDGILINDGLHADLGSPGMNAVLDYAKEAQKDPTKKFTLIHTAVNPGKYISTTETSNYLLNQLGMKRKPIENWNGKGKAPVSKAESGGFQVYQLYDKELPYETKDPTTGKVKPNVIQNGEALTSGGQHIVSNKSLGDYIKDMF